MLPSAIMEILSHLSAPILIAAAAILFARTHSPWMLAAAILETISLLFRAGLYFNAQFIVGSPLFMGAWQLIGLLMAVCFLGFALTWQRDED
jgi:hypothetical protein